MAVSNPGWENWLDRLYNFRRLAMMTETCRQFKRIDLRREKRAWIFY
jgi:hypothetical protein